jgi:hypothetical protein
MRKLVASGATLRCSKGTQPSTLTVLPANGTDDDDAPVATVMDHRPMVNIAPFGLCTATANPQVAAATSAAQGVLTPQPCVPVLAAPWSPGASAVLIDDQKALTDDSRCDCAWTGSIEITEPSAKTEVA